MLFSICMRYKLRHPSTLLVSMVSLPLRVPMRVHVTNNPITIIESVSLCCYNGNVTVAFYLIIIYHMGFYKECAHDL